MHRWRAAVAETNAVDLAIHKRLRAARTTNPFFIVNLAEVRAQIRRWKQELPMVQPFYAVKCNPDPRILETLASEGTGFDCASQEEIKLCLRTLERRSAWPRTDKIAALKSLRTTTTDDAVEEHRVTDAADRIIYANPCKQDSHLRYARDHGVSWTTFDNEAELLKLRRIAPTAHLLLRIFVDDSASTCPLGRKYGATPTEAQSLMCLAKHLGLPPLGGISFHTGSGCTDPTAFDRAVELAAHHLHIGKQMGHGMNVLDIGGGFPAPVAGAGESEREGTTRSACVRAIHPHSEPGQQWRPVPLFETVAQHVRTALKGNQFLLGDTQIVAEPGRFLVASSQTLVARIIGKRQRRAAPASIGAKSVHNGEDAKEEAGATVFDYYLNDGVYGSLNNLVLDHASLAVRAWNPCDGQVGSMNNNNSNDHTPPPGRLFTSRLWGPTCDALDNVASQVLLPEMHVGQWMVFPNMGAYTGCASTRFNGFTKPVSVYIT